MKHRFNLEIKACVNRSTHAAELYVVNDEYDGMGRGIVVRQKHITSCLSNDHAEAEAERFCRELQQKIEDFVRQECKGLTNAKP